MERQIITYGGYFDEFIQKLNEKELKKLDFILDVLATQDIIPAKFVSYIQDGLYEIRMEYESNIYRVFFCFDEGNLVVLFNGFQKKSQKTPRNEIRKALKIKNEYYGNKK